MARRRTRRGYRPNKPTEIPWVLVGGAVAVGVLFYLANRSGASTVASAYVPNNVSAAKPLPQVSVPAAAAAPGGGGPAQSEIDARLAQARFAAQQLASKVNIPGLRF